MCSVRGRSACRLRYFSWLILSLFLAWPRAAQAAPTYQASSAMATSTGADVTVTLPAHAANDILLIQVLVFDQNDTITWPSGWTQLATVDRSTTRRYWWAYKRAASSSETNPLVDKSTATGDTAAVVTTYRGAVTAGNPWDVIGTPASGTVAGAVLNGVTSLTNNVLIIASVCGENSIAVSSVAYTATSPATLTANMYLEVSTMNEDIVCASGSAAQATAGATGNVTATWNGAPTGWGGVVLALKPGVSSFSLEGIRLEGVKVN